MVLQWSNGLERSQIKLGQMVLKLGQLGYQLKIHSECQMVKEVIGSIIIKLG